MNESTIISVIARETFSDSGYPAVEVEVITENGAKGIGCCSENYSTSTLQPKYLYDGGTRFHGLGVSKAAQLINDVLAPALIGLQADEQTKVDERIIQTMAAHGIPKYVNVSSPVSIAVLHAGADAKHIPLYRHVGGQSAFTIPVTGHLVASGSKRYGEHHKAKARPYYLMVAYDFPTYEQAHYAMWEVANQYEKVISREFNYVTHRGFSMAIPKDKIKNDYVLWDAISTSIKECGYEGKIGIHIDVGANEYYNPDTGLYEGLFDETPKTRDDLIALIKDMAQKYPFVIIEDPLEQNDLDGYAELVRDTHVQIAGDDICSSNMERIRYCITHKCINSVVLPVNRFETFSDAVKVVRLAKAHGVDVMIRDMCGEGYDACAYAIGFNAGTIFSCGLNSHGNQLLMTAEDIGPRVKFYGKRGLQGSKFAL